MIARYKAEGREKEMQKALNEIKKQVLTMIPFPLAYVSDSFDIKDQFTTVHNYIDTDTMILRKGSVSAKSGEKLLITINMRDGSLICIGKGNGERNMSAPHGAGRLMSRTKSKQRLTVSEFKKQMNGIYTTTNFDSSDVDIRGCALNSGNELLSMSSFEQVIDTNTDTTIYSFHKLIELVSAATPTPFKFWGAGLKIIFC